MSIISFIKKTKAYGPLGVIKSTIPHIPEIICGLMFRLFPIKNNKVVFSSFHGKQFNSEPKKISDALLANVQTNYDVVWILPDDIPKSNAFRTVRPNSLKALFELYTSKVWVDNCRKDYWIKKRNRQLYIQTWHGSVCLKAVEKDASETLHPYYIKSAKQDSKNADYIVAESLWRKNNILSSFWYRGKIIEAEFKKGDMDNEESIRRKIRRTFSLETDTKIVLYVPTFRRNEETRFYLHDYDPLMKSLTGRFGGIWATVVRLHPNIANKANFIKYNNSIINGTDYPSIDELIIGADLIITDYSGCIFQGLRSNKFVLLYAEDYDEYVSSDRNMYFDLACLPSPMAKNLEGLIEIINSFSTEEYAIKRSEFVEKLGFYSNDAAAVCADIIRANLKPEE